jgi:hypothetical protein
MFPGCSLRRETSPASVEGRGEEEGHEGGQVLGEARPQEHRQILQHMARMSPARFDKYKNFYHIVKQAINGS